MKNRILKFAALVGAMSVPAVANAQPGSWYVAVDVGQHATGEVNITPTADDVDIGVQQDWSAALRAGRAIGEHWRVEAEFTDRPADYGSSYTVLFKGEPEEEAFSGELNTTSLMGNVIYDFAPGQRLRPFVGLGVGAVMFDMTLDGTETDVDSAFAWQALGGVSWRVAEKVNVDLTYRYLASEVDNAILEDVSYQNQAFSIGLRYTF